MCAIALINKTHRSQRAHPLHTINGFCLVLLSNPGDVLVRMQIQCNGQHRQPVFSVVFSFVHSDYNNCYM